MQMTNAQIVADKRYIIDASISAVPAAQELIDDVINGVIPNATLVITSLSRIELNNLQKHKDQDARGARKILAKMAENPSFFENVWVERRPNQLVDDCIVEYCKTDLNKNILLTADKDMAGAARELGVETIYFKHPKKGDITTLYKTKIRNGKLILDDLNSPYMGMLVLKEIGKHTRGPVKLDVGDNVYICSRKSGYIAFAHYQITNLQEEDNSRLVYSKRIYFGSNAEIPEIYRDFINEFRYRNCYKKKEVGKKKKR